MDTCLCHFICIQILGECEYYVEQPKQIWRSLRSLSAGKFAFTIFLTCQKPLIDLSSKVMRCKLNTIFVCIVQIWKRIGMY